MSYSLSKKEPAPETRSVASGSDNSTDDDNKLLEIGYVPSFKREFSNIATVRTPFLRLSPMTFDVDPDQLRVQHHGSLLKHCYNLQHSSDPRWTRLGDMVLDSGGDDVLHSRCVSLSHALSPRCQRLPRASE